MMDIVYSQNDKAAGDGMRQKQKLGARPVRAYKPVDRSQQGAALSGAPQFQLDRKPDSMVECSSLVPVTAAATDTQNAPPRALEEVKIMQLTLKGLNAKNTTAIYSGAPGSIRIGLSAFPDRTAPATIDVADGVFAVKPPKPPKLTKEERAALPKPTQAELVARMEARLAKAKAKLAEDDGIL
jgi:hypothetical protein